MNYSKIKYVTDISVNESYQGEYLTDKIERVTNNNEPIDSTAPVIYTERNEGVQAGYNVRTDRFDIALEAMGKIEKSKIAKREAAEAAKSDGRAEPIQGEQVA